MSGASQWRSNAMTEEVKSDDDATPLNSWEEAKAIADLTGFHYEENWHLRSIMAIRKMVIAEVVNVYTLVDQMLDEIISQHFIVRPIGSDEGPDDKWRSKLGEKRTQFRQLILDNLFLLKKKDIVHNISGKMIKGDIPDIFQRINTVRNDLTHSARPWDRKPNLEGQVYYNKVNIYSLAGVKEVQKEYQKVMECLRKIYLDQVKQKAD
jgi:hypothetical protein